MTFSKVPHKTILRVNGVQCEALGSGDADQGLVTTQLEHTFDFDPELLAPLVIVGYHT